MSNNDSTSSGYSPEYMLWYYMYRLYTYMPPQTWPAAKSPMDIEMGVSLNFSWVLLHCRVWSPECIVEAAFDFAAGPFLLLDIEASLVFHMAVKTVPYPKIVGKWMVIPLIWQK